jgi:hypothetical protein
VLSAIARCCVLDFWISGGRIENRQLVKQGINAGLFVQSPMDRSGFVDVQYRAIADQQVQIQVFDRINCQSIQGSIVFSPILLYTREKALIDGRARRYRAIADTCWRPNSNRYRAIGEIFGCRISGSIVQPPMRFGTEYLVSEGWHRAIADTVLGESPITRHATGDRPSCKRR